MDVKIAFLNGDLEEEIYMAQPEGCIVPSQENKVCKLIKSLYGLKQAPKQWHEKFDQVLISNEFSTVGIDKYVYTKTVDSGFVIISLYVDDMLISGTCIDVVNKIKCFLAFKFDMKDLGEVKVILGIKIIRCDSGLILTQEHYVERLLKRFGHFDIIPVSTPYDSNIQLKKNRDDSVAQFKYAHIIRSLMHLMNYTPPDIAYVVCRLSRYTQSPNRDHWITLSKVMKYLKGTINYGILCNGFLVVLEGYSYANWISDSDETNSTSGYVFTLGGCAITWKSAKQTIIGKSTMESEFVPLELAGNEAGWLRNLLADIPLGMKPTPYVSMHCDCQAAITIAKNKTFNGKNRHIRLRHDVVKQMLRDGIISINYVKSELNLASPLTKPLGRKLINATSRGMRLKPNEKINK